MNPAFATPFRDTYSQVEGRMKAVADKLQGDDQKWFQTLIVQFREEYENWDTNQCLKYYRHEWQSLNWSVLWLIAGAYLHVGYDLPRVICKNWPGSPPNWDGLPSEEDGERLYFQVADIFSMILIERARETTNTGWMSYIFRVTPRGVLEVAAHWILNLRSVAWINARRLKLSGETMALREAAMIRGMTAALKHVRFLRPLPSYVPSARLAAVAIYDPITGAILPGFNKAWLGGAVASAAFGGASAFFIWKQQREQAYRAFTDEFGRRVYQYINVAVRDPYGFPRYLEKRMQEDKIPADPG